MDRNRRCPVNVEMLREIMAVKFALIETVLYLNTHPDDRVVLELHNDFAMRLMNLMNEYQEKYCLIRPTCAKAKDYWNYVNEPWPWQIEY